LARYLTVGARRAPPQATVIAARAASATALGGLIDAGDSLGVVVPFGAQGRDRRLTRGLTLAVNPGGVLYAPFNARVGYAGPLEGYGQVVILLGPDREALVVTGLAETSLQEGAQLTKGARLGAVAAAVEDANDGARLTSLASQAPELYLEVRKDGRFIDPSQWLRDRN
jgi:septal ring factor EnvC (AmiA/AmiB activator)